MSILGSQKAKEKRDADATVPTPNRDQAAWADSGMCKVCGEPLKAKVTGFGAIGTKCMCAENALMTSVPAMGLIREGDGWVVVEFLLPEQVAGAHVVKRHPAQGADVVAAKLEEWVNRKAMGLK